LRTFQTQKDKVKPFDDLAQEKKKETCIPMISNKQINLLANSLQQSENLAASNYVQYQKHFVVLNSMLNKNLDGIILLKDGIPGFFDLERNQSAHFMFKSDADNNPKGTIRY